MNVLEKILEEIENEAMTNKEIGRKQCEGMARAMNIIRSHMDDGKDTNVSVNDGWIPVSERLPEDGTYLCTLDGELCGIDEPFTGMCGIENGKWDEEGCVIAWQPLPAPYKGE